MKINKIVLEVSSRCNFNCKHCPVSNNENKCDMNISIIDNIKENILECNEISLFGWGEPLCNPDFKDFITRIRDISDKVIIYFTTNGSLITQELAMHFIEKKVNYISISLDNLKNNGFRHFPINIIRNNIAFLLQNNDSYPHLRFTTTLSKLNIKELPDIIEFSNSIGIKEVNCVFMTAYFDNQRENTLYGAEELVREEFEKARTIADKLGVKLILPSFTPPRKCDISKNEIFINSFGELKPCIIYPESFGNVFKKSISNIILSQEYINTVKKISENEICNFCTKCQYLDINSGRGFFAVS